LPSIPFAIMAGEYEENFIFHHSASKKFVGGKPSAWSIMSHHAWIGNLAMTAIGWNPRRAHKIYSHCA
jgi:hypothetical protein